MTPQPNPRPDLASQAIPALPLRHGQAASHPLTGPRRPAAMC
ncbi:MAG: hypothetical protein ACK41W_17460 [Cyanobacteriota bacterium]